MRVLDAKQHDRLGQAWLQGQACPFRAELRGRTSSQVGRRGLKIPEHRPLNRTLAWPPLWTGDKEYAKSCSDASGHRGPAPAACSGGRWGAREALPAPLPLAPELPSPPPSLPPSFSCLSSLPLCLSPVPWSPAQSWLARCPLGVGSGRRFSLLTLESDLRVGGVVTGTHILGDLTLRVLS